MLLSFLAALGCALCYGLGSVLQGIGAKRVEASASLNPRGLAKVATQAPYLAGLALDALGWGLSLVALYRLPVFVVQSVVAGSIGFTVLFAAAIQRRQPSGRQVAWIFVLMAGLAGLGISGAPERATQVGGTFTVAMWISVVLIGLAGAIVPRFVSGQAAAIVLAALAGLAFGGTALCARSAVGHLDLRTLLDPLTWALAAFGGLGLAFFAAALQRGSVTVTTAWLFTTETVAPALVGAMVLGDHARPGMGMVVALAFVATLAGAVGLSLASPDLADQANG